MDYIQRCKKELEPSGKEHSGYDINRRIFMQLAVGLAAISPSTLLVACDNTEQSTIPTATSIDVLTVWGGNEAKAFKRVTDNFKAKYHITVNIESTRNEDAVLTTRMNRNDPPDIAVLPNPGKVLQLAQCNKLIQLEQILDMKQFRRD
jgi:alpha-glucoside transport system substrate-binding protein